MSRKIAAKYIRTGALLAAGGGILFSFVFHAYEETRDSYLLMDENDKQKTVTIPYKSKKFHATFQ